MKRLFEILTIFGLITSGLYVSYYEGVYRTNRMWNESPRSEPTTVVGIGDYERKQFQRDPVAEGRVGYRLDCRVVQK